MPPDTKGGQPFWGDAAGAAASYLCYRRGPLLDEAAIRSALLSYNRSIPYGNQVIANGERYRDALDLPDLAPLPDGAAPPKGRPPA